MREVRYGSEGFDSKFKDLDGLVNKDEDEEDLLQGSRRRGCHRNSKAKLARVGEALRQKG